VIARSLNVKLTCLESCGKKEIDLFEFLRAKKQIGNPRLKIEMIKNSKRLICVSCVGEFAAEVPIDLIYEEGTWSPSISQDDALKLDRVREALGNDDVSDALNDAKVFQLLPVQP
jgi:hypothetical protein